MNPRYLAFAKSIPFPVGLHINAEQERCIAAAVERMVEIDLLLRLAARPKRREAAE
jgi:hypothetical protein